MIATGQLLALGVSRQAVGRAAERGRLHRVHRGVYSLLPARARPAFAPERAALLACGPLAVLSHHSAAALLGLRLPVRSSEVHVLTTAAHRPDHRGVRVHRTHSLPRAERTWVAGLPATSLGRALLDLAPELTDRMLEPLIDQALRGTSRRRILATLDAHPRRPGASRIRALLDPARPSAETWSRREARLRAAIERAGLPLPECNVPVGRYVADLYWREQRLIVEFDSYAFHGGPAAFHGDRDRHNDLEALADCDVLHVTARQLDHALERVLVWIAVRLAGRGL